MRNIICSLLIAFSSACGSDSSGSSEKSGECSSCLKGCSTVCSGDTDCIRYVACNKDCDWDDSTCFDVCEVMYPSALQGSVNECQQVACKDTCFSESEDIGNYCATMTAICENGEKCSGGGSVYIEVAGDFREYDSVSSCTNYFTETADCETNIIFEQCSNDVGLGNGNGGPGDGNDNNPGLFCQNGAYIVPNSCLAN